MDQFSSLDGPGGPSPDASGSGISVSASVLASGQSIGVNFLDASGNPTNITSLGLSSNSQPVLKRNGTAIPGVRWFYNTIAAQQAPQILGFLPQSLKAPKYYSCRQGVDTVSGNGWHFVGNDPGNLVPATSYSGSPIITNEAGDSYSRFCDGLPPGTYQVAMTWSADPTLATNAVVTIQTLTSGAVDSGAVTSVTVNQAATPNDFTLGGFGWKILGSFTIAWPTTGFQFKLTNPGGKVSFDSLQLTRSSADLSVTFQPGDTGTVDLPASWAITAAGPVTGPISAGPTVADFDFSTPTAADLGTYNPTGTAWTFSGSAPASPGGFPLANSNGSGVGALNSSFVYGSFHNPTNSVSSQFGFLSESATISQTVAGWAAGTYAIQFYATCRYYQNASTLNVSVDGTVVGTFTIPAYDFNSFGVYSTTAFHVTAGSHTIEFYQPNPATDFPPTVLLQQVTIQTATGVTGIPVTNNVGTSPLGSPNIGQVPTTAIGYNVEADTNPSAPALLYSNLATRAQFYGQDGVVSTNANGYVTLGSQQTINNLIPIAYSGLTWRYGTRFGTYYLPNGYYTLTWDGTDVYNLMLLGQYTITEITSYQILGQPTGNRRVFNLQSVSSQFYSPEIFLSVASAQPSADGSGHYKFSSANLSVVPPSPSDSTGLTPWLTGVTKWYPTTMGWLDNSSFLRDMGWKQTNDCSIGTYADLRLPGTLAGPCRVITSTINTISNVSGTPFIAQNLYVSFQVGFTTPHGLFESAYIKLTPAQQINYTDGTNDPANVAISGFVHVIDAHTIEFMNVFKQKSGTTLTLTAPVAGGSILLQTGVGTSPWLDFLDLCAAKSSGLHCNIPIGCDDGSITQMAHDCAARLPAGAKVHVEWSNEHWNYFFVAFHWLQSLSYKMTGNSASATPAYVAGAAHAHSVFRAAWVAAGRNAADMIRVMGSQGGYSGVTSDICTAAKAQGVTFDQLDVSNYIGNQSSYGTEDSFQELFDGMPKDQLLDYFDFNLQYGKYEHYVTDHLAVLQAAGFTNVQVGFYEAGFQSILPGNSIVNGFERSYEAINHPRVYGQQFYWQQRMQDVGGANKINIFYLFGAGLTSSLNGAGQGTPNLWSAFTACNQVRGTGNSSLDAVNVNSPLAFNQVKSELGGAISLWNSLRPGSTTSTRGYDSPQKRTTGRKPARHHGI